MSKPHFPWFCAFCSRSGGVVRPWCGPPGSAGSARVCGRGAGRVIRGHLLIGPETDQFFSTEHLRWDVAAECTAGSQRPADDEQSGKDLIVIMGMTGRPAREPHSWKCAGPPFAGHAGDSNVVQRAPPRRGEQGGPPAGPVASDRNSGPRDGGRSSGFLAIPINGQTSAAKGSALTPVQAGIRPALRPGQNKHSNVGAGPLAARA